MEQQKSPMDTATPPPAADAAAAPGRVGRAKEFVSEKVSAASDAVKNKYTAVRQKVEEADMGEMAEKVRDYVRQNPGKALLISVGIGFVIGLLMRRSRDDD